MHQTINKIFALILLLFFLLLPAAVFAHASQMQAFKDDAVSVQAPDNGSPNEGSPCSDAQDMDCCEGACSCNCHAPLAQRVTIVYSPFVVRLYHPEYQRAPPQVYLSIFVPPQNFSV